LTLGASARPHAPEARGPALAVTYPGDDPELLVRMLPLVEVLEIPPDAIAASTGGRAHLRESALREFDRVKDRVQLVAHSVGLSIASFDSWNEDYFRLMDELFARFELAWHSDHLGYTTVGGENLGVMLPAPRSKEALDLICQRVDRIQDRYAAPFLLEHIIELLPEAPADYSPAAFLNEITRRTSCGLILDAYNIDCDVRNNNFDVANFFSELDFSPVRELHLAGGVSHDGFQLDIHLGPVSDSTMALALEILRRTRTLPVVTFEYLRETASLLGHEGIVGELERIRRIIGNA
jgi:uncharacterized protein